MQKKLLLTLLALSTIHCPNGLFGDPIMIRAVRTARLLNDRTAQAAVESFQEAAESRPYAWVFGEQPQSLKEIRIHPIRGQDYTRTGVCIQFRLRSSSGKSTTEGVASALMDASLFCKKDPSPADISNPTACFSKDTIGAGFRVDDKGTLRNGYITVKSEITDSLRHGEYLAFYLETKKNGCYYFVVKNIDEWKWLRPAVTGDLPALTFTNASAIAANEDFSIAHLIPFVTGSLNFLRFHVGGTRVDAGLSLFASADVIGLLNVRGQVFTSSDRGYVDYILPRTVYFGVLGNIESSGRHYYFGCGANFREGWGMTNPRKPEDSLYNPAERVQGPLLDFGVVIGATVLDWFDLIKSLLPKAPESDASPG